jgi:YegS/Rv2252/BmrU family lipid kinase
MTRRLQLVVNPSAGGGRGAKLLPAVEARLRAAGHDLVITPTRSLEHAEELAATAVADERVAVAMGGDGIVGRVAGAVSSHGGVMGVVPAGRGNDFCRVTGVPGRALPACEVLTTGVPRPVDLGVVETSTGTVPFVGIASVGFDSDVQERVLRSRLRLGNLVYLYGALATVARWRHATFCCDLDGAALEVRGWSVAVANSGMYGGGMRLAPDARLDDGRLDVVTSAATGPVAFLRALPKVFQGTHVDEPSVSVSQARVVGLSADRPFRVFADGDPVGALPATVTVRPGAVQVLLPAERG